MTSRNSFTTYASQDPPSQISAGLTCSHYSEPGLDNQPDHHSLCPQAEEVVVCSEDGRGKIQGGNQ